MLARVHLVGVDVGTGVDGSGRQGEAVVVVEQLTADHAPMYPGPTVVVAGRLDSTVGYAAAADLVDHYPHASLAVLDDAGHALPHEQPELLRALIVEWLTRVERLS